MTPLAQAQVVFRKELKDAFRDKRSLYSILIGSLFGPLVTGFMLNTVADRQRQIEEVRIPVVGIEHAPAMMNWLRQQAGVEIVKGPESHENGRFAWIMDPDGVKVELWQQLGPAPE